VIGEANDGHLPGATGGGGNAGCIGVCVSPTINIPLKSVTLRLQMGFHKAIL
jgi:hypothetical protein